MNYKELFESWKKQSDREDVLRDLAAMENDDAKIRDCFYKDLEFGTGGLRGIMNAGPNCLNYYTIVKTTKGIADYMAKNNMKRIAVDFDSRNNSKFFAETVAAVMATCGMEVFVAESCCPTPFLSFSVRYLHCDIGVNITASHNPAEYNGYKVYGADGCQLTDKACEVVTDFIEKVDPFEVKVTPFEQLLSQGKINYIRQDVVDNFLDCVFAQSLGDAKGVTIAYSPLCGTGYPMVSEILRRIGTDALFTVENQKNPDGNFPTCPRPNPELTPTLQEVVALAKANNTDIAIATDPDCDRIGVVVRQNGEYVRLTGNEVGVILLDFVLSSLQKCNKLPQNGVMVKTIVTTTLAEKLAASFGIRTVNLLTGFKYIGEFIGRLENEGRQNDFVFGYEESCGYLRGTYVRDKDAIVASMLVAEAVAFYKKQGLTFVDRLNQLYAKFGRYKHETISFRFEGADGAARKAQLLADIRKNGIENLAGAKIVHVRDFLLPAEDNLPLSDVLKYTAADGSELVVRPSGTEPLIKAYITVCADEATNKEKIAQIRAMLDKIFA